MQPLVALESTVIAHGLPFPHNLETANRLQALIIEEEALPQTIGVIGGVPVAGLSAEQIELMAKTPEMPKISLRDLPIAAVRGMDGATTVAATMWIAHRYGIRVFATGGIGGVHLGAPFDVSADLEALATVPIVVVCAGAKAILDLRATREVLETRGVTVVGYGTDELPAFYSRTSGLRVDARCDSAEEVAAIWRAQRRLGLPGALLVVAPVPAEHEIPAGEIEPFIRQADAEARAQGVQGAALTPFLLERLRVLTEGRSLRTNVALLENNARIGARIAHALAERLKHD